MVEVESSSPEDTERIAGALAAMLAPGDVVTVAGELGAGKTTFVRGACRALGVTEPVTSPTYTIGHRYAGRVPVSHLDLYRLGRLEEADWADVEAYFDDAVALVEWPEAGEAFLPPARAAVRLRVEGPAHRVLVVESGEKPLENAVSSAAC